MPSQINIFVTGATGYIGGTVVNRLLAHTQASSFKITALVRSEEKAQKFKSLGIETIIGSYTDKDLTFITNAAASSDVVISAADSDNLVAASAILAGLKLRHEKTGKASILIHTSGTAFISDDARGLHGNHTVYDDSEVEKLDAIPVSVIHRNVDIPIIEADRAGYVRAYIIAPSMVFGHPKGPLVDLKIQNTHSVVVPYLVKMALARKQAGYFGEGLNRISATHVEETADLYTIILDSALKNAVTAPHGYYFAESLIYTTIDVSTAIGETLLEHKLITDKNPNSLSQEELDQYSGPLWKIFASNNFAKGSRGRALGWKPVATVEDFLADIKQETTRLLSENK